MKTNSIYHPLLVLARGIGQVMFQDHALSGLLMLTGIAVHSWQMALLAIGGNFISTLTAYLSGYDRDDIRHGLYGFNGTLVGIAAGVFLQLSPTTLLLAALAACVSTWITRLFNAQHRLSGFTAPFILATWMLLGICTYGLPETLTTSDTTSGIPVDTNYFQAFCLGIGQVMFQDHLLSGVLFGIGILIHSRTAAFYASLGALLPLPLATLYGIDSNVINLGLMGYNGVLCAIALGDTRWSSFGWASASVCLSVGLQIIGMNLHITTLTAPFVLSVWMIQGLQKIVKQKGK